MLFTPEDLADAGLGAKNFLKELAGDALRNACELYSQFPRGFAGDNPLANGANKVNSLVWDSLCGRLPEQELPPPPSRQFTGGQCCDKSYRLEYSFTRVYVGYGGGGGGNVEGPFTQSTFLVPGSLVAVEERANKSQLWYVVQKCDGTLYEQILFGDGAYEFTVTSVSVTPADGSADNCGDLPASYPAGLPPASNPYTLPYVGNDGLQRDINYSIDFSLTFNGPTINLPDLPNVCASFNLYGVDIDLCTNVPGSGSGGGISEGDLERLLEAADKVSDIEENVKDLSRKGESASENKGEKEGSTDESTGPIYGIIVSVTTVPVGYGRKFGEPQVFDFGRATFKRGGVFFSPVPINLVSNFIPAPVDADGYSLTLNPGVKANVTVIKKVEE